MYRQLPTANKILTDKWNTRQHHIHENKVRTMKSSVDTGRPATWGKIRSKAKKEQLIEDRYTEIERENRILLEKMQTIMSHRTTSLDGRHVRHKSLNSGYRRRQLMKISMENQAILKRLQAKGSNYDVNSWEKERKLSEHRLKYMCEFPYQLATRAESPRSPRNRSARSPLNRSIRQSTRGTKRKNSAPIQSKEIILTTQKELNGKIFTIKISRNKRKVYMKVHSEEAPQRADLVLGDAQVREILGNLQEYHRLADMLIYEKGQFVLDVDSERKDEEEQV